jgi:hypothetical protein
MRTIDIPEEDVGVLVSDEEMHKSPQELSHKYADPISLSNDEISNEDETRVLAQYANVDSNSLPSAELPSQSIIEPAYVNVKYEEVKHTSTTDPQPTIQDTLVEYSNTSTLPTTENITTEPQYVNVVYTTPQNHSEKHLYPPLLSLTCLQQRTQNESKSIQDSKQSETKPIVQQKKESEFPRKFPSKVLLIYQCININFRIGDLYQQIKQNQFNLYLWCQMVKNHL